MNNFYIRVLSCDGYLEAEHAVQCTSADLWRHAAQLAVGAEDGTRLHLMDEAGELLAIVGARSAVLLNARAREVENTFAARARG